MTSRHDSTLACHWHGSFPAQTDKEGILMAASLKKQLLKTNSVDSCRYGYNSSLSNQHEAYNMSVPIHIDRCSPSSCNNNASFRNESLVSQNGVCYSKSHTTDVYNNVSSPHLHRAFSPASNHSSYSLKQRDSPVFNIRPPGPPSPDISHLTLEELSILKRVFKREEIFEREEKERLREMEHRLKTYEHTVTQDSGKLKHIDLRLCRLCFKTKFADGIGRVCHDCRRRVCGRCGTYSAPHWNQRKQKNVRGKWRCNICHLKLEFVCQSGTWFHGNKTFSVDTNPIRDKIQFHDADYSDTDNQTSVDSSSCFSASEICTDTDIHRFGGGIRAPKNMQNRSRRRSVPIVLRSSPSENDSESDDSVERTRTHVQQMRVQRRNSARRRSLKQRQQQQQQQQHLTDLQNQENVYNGDLPSGYEVNGGNISPCAHVHSMQRLSATNDIDNHVRRHSDDGVRRGSVSLCFKSDDSQTDEQSPSKGSHPRVSNHNNSCYSPARSVSPRDTWSYDVQLPPSPSRVVSGYRMSIPGLSPRSSITTLTVDGSVSPLEHRRHSHAPCSSAQGYKSDRKRYSIDQHTGAAGHKVKQTYLMPPESPASRCRRWSSDSGSSRRSSGETALSTDWNEDTKVQEYLSSLKSRDVLLYRDKNDQNCRCNGLGMRVVGGQCRFGKRLGAFVTDVDADGPADSYGILEGDQVLMWNGKSLVDTTFEETKSIVNQSSEIVQLVVVHHEENYGSVDKTETADDTEQENNIPSIVQPLPLPPSALTLNKPKRRMLPKTPIEMKKEDRMVSGKLQMSISYSIEAECLAVTLVQADDLRLPGQLEVSVINPIALVNLLPGRGFFPPYETIPQFNTVSPRWNETFNIMDVTASEVTDKSVEITIWNQHHSEDEFLGEVLLDIVDANMADEIVSYDLQDHDENSSPLPKRRRKESYSTVTTTSQISPLTPTLDTSSNWSLGPTHMSSQNIHSDGGRHSADDRNIAQSPLRSRSITRSNSFSAKMKRKLAVAMSRMSSTFSVNERRLSLQDEKMTNRSLSADGILGSLGPPIARPPRHSTTEGYKGAMNVSAGHFLDVTRTNRPSHTYSDPVASIYDENSDGDDINKSFGMASPDRPAPDGDDITSMLGPSQVPPRPASEQSVCGDIRLGLMVTQGQLEIDVIGVTGLLRDSENSPPDTYVKTYLVEGTKVIQKKKTSMSKASYEPTFHRKIKYSACNIHGRSIKVKIWSRQGAFDKKLCLGETVIKLDGLDLSRPTLSWYKLFPQGATDFSSNESLSF